jgi:Trp operon repressor
VLELYEGYQSMMRTAAWKHYVGLLSSVETDLREKVLNGMLHPQTGQDLTPVLRMAQHLMTQVLALPERIARMRAEDERDILGLAGDTPEPPLTAEEEASLRREMIGA